MGRRRRRKHRKPASESERPPSRRERVLAVVRDDNTFAQATVRGETVWLGRCLMCGTKVLVSLEGELLGRATLEHIEPRNHGGTDAPENLAIACRRCNHAKGARHDNRRREDPRRLEVVAQLLATKRARAVVGLDGDAEA